MCQFFQSWRRSWRPVPSAQHYTRKQIIVEYFPQESVQNWTEEQIVDVCPFARSRKSSKLCSSCQKSQCRIARLSRLCEHHISHVHFSCVINSDTCAHAGPKFGSVLTHPIPRSCFMCHLVCLSDCPLFDISIHFFFLTFFSLITLSFLLPVNFIFQDVVDKSPVQLC